jgi:hypothetical protein
MLQAYQKGLYTILKLGLFAFIAGYFFFPSTTSHRIFFYLLVLLPWLLLLPTQPGIIPVKEPLFLGTTVLLLYLWATVFWSVDSSIQAVWHFGKKAIYPVALISAIWLVVNRDPKSEDALLRVLVVVGTLAACVSLGVYFATLGLQFARLDPVGRVDSPIRGATIYGAIGLISIWSYLNASDRRSVLAYGLTLIPLIMLMVFTGSRGPLAAWLLSVPLLILVVRPNARQEPVGIRREWVLLGGVAFFLLFWSGVVGWRNFLERTSYRDVIWGAVLREVFEFPWFGQGIRNNVEVVTGAGLVFAHSHNFLLSVLRFGGLLGLSLTLIHLVWCTLSGFRSGTAQSRLWGVWLIYGSLCLLTNGKYPLSEPTEAWFVYWIPIAFLCAWSARKPSKGQPLKESSKVPSSPVPADPMPEH